MDMSASPRRHDEPLRFGRILSHLGAMGIIAVVLGVLVGGLAIPYVAALGVTSKTAARDIQNLPKALEANDLAQSSRLIDSRGRPIATFFDENRKTVTRQQISQNMIDAIIAVEDYRFYEHGALDLQGTLRAFLRNQAGGGVVQGGSSITQQLAKMELLNLATTDEARAAATADTYTRKIQELRHAIAFEENYSKDWILTRYLNMANFGDRAWGVQAAAQHYFSVDAKDLSVPQAALLAGLVKNPTNYNPTEYPEDARIRRDIVLDQMAKYGKIGVAQAEKAKARDLNLKVRPIRNGCQVSREPLFCDYVIASLLEDESLGETRDDRLRLIQTGGLTIKATMDSRFQDAADAATADAVEPTDQAVGAIAMVEPGTGHVKAISQSRPVGQRRDLGQTSLNFAVPTELGKAQSFQGGSTFKAFVLAAALEEGINPRRSTTVPAQASLPNNSFRTCNGPYTSTEVWTPSNFDGSGGTFDLYSGTQLSVNTFFAELERETGMCKPYRLAKQLGIRLTQPDQGEMVPSFTLGVASVSPLEMAEAYATFANRGVHCAAQPVTEILNNRGKVFKTYDNDCSRVMSQYTADTVNDILRGVMEPGGFGQNLGVGVASAGKTGTIQNNAAVWFSGYTADIATAAVIGGANSNGVPVSLNFQTVGGNYIGSRASGSGVAGPMWQAATAGVVPFLDGGDFTRPGAPPAGSQAEAGAVPSTVGMSTDQAVSTLQAAGFNAVVGPAIDSRQAAGIVAGQNPDGGTNAPAGSTVTVFPSNGSRFENASTTDGGGNGGGGDNGNRGRGNGNGRGGGNG